MLVTKPEGAKAVITEAWQNTKPIPIEMHKKLWKEVEKESPLFGQKNVNYSTWTEEDKKFEGMRDENQKKQGVCRYVNNGGKIHQASYKNDSLHGLEVIWSTNKDLYASIFNNGTDKGWIRWNKNWKEIKGVNKDYARKFFTVDDFKK